MSIRPQDVRRRGKLIYLQAPRVLVTVTDGKQSYKLFSLAFPRDGGLQVHFPYFHRNHGFLKNLRFLDGTVFPHNVHLAEDSHLTSNHVKYSHHIDGEAHFSQDGRIFTRVRRKSFRLDGPIGHLFQMSAHRIQEGFQVLTSSDLRPHRPTIEFLYDDIPEGISVVAEWVRFGMIEKLIALSPEPVGPALTVDDLKHPGLTDDWFFAAPFSPRSTATHFLKLTSVGIKEPENTEDPFYLFVGGWDEHEVPDASHSVTHTGALFSVYPVKYQQLLTDGAMPIDLVPPSA